MRVQITLLNVEHYRIKFATERNPVKGGANPGIEQAHRKPPIVAGAERDAEDSSPTIRPQYFRPTQFVPRNSFPTPIRPR